MQTVYFFWERGEDRFKIGKTVNLGGRMSGPPQEIDLERSTFVECERSPYRLEKVLLEVFADQRIRHPHGGDGSTEWFPGECGAAVGLAGNIYLQLQRLSHDGD